MHACYVTLASNPILYFNSEYEIFTHRNFVSFFLSMFLFCVRHAQRRSFWQRCRSLRISIPYADSVCSSSAESSDCEGSTYPQAADAPTEIIPGLFLGNASHSEDLKALQCYNIKYILNVTPDLPNHFENASDIKYQQIPITDHGSQDLSMYFPTAIKFIGMCIDWFFFFWNFFFYFLYQFRIKW